MSDKSIQELEAEFYAKKFYLSYSGLNKLLYSPVLFYKHYILQQREERLDSHLINGKVIHCLLLNNGEFDDQFIISPNNLPTGNTRLVIDKLYNIVKEGPGLLNNYTVEINSILKEINLHQSLTDDKKADKKGNIRTADEKRLEKIIDATTTSYFEFLKRKGNKDIIDQETYDACMTSVTLIKENSLVLNLLGLDKEEENITIFNEVLLHMDDPNIPEFGTKGILDNVKIDYNRKIIYVNDLKTSGKTLSEFKESIDYYKYWMQAAIYVRLIKDFCKDKIDDTWEIMFTFIVIDKYQQVYAFPVSKDTMLIWQKQLDDKLTEARWHYSNNSYTLPYEFIKEQVYL